MRHNQARRRSQSWSRGLRGLRGSQTRQRAM